ncbi:MAG: hypothetical protein GF331_01250 [Chitinivibrionales bacterium]|nr:hypothetical protein [Chitinivibrionales bacterium]
MTERIGRLTSAIRRHPVAAGAVLCALLSGFFVYYPLTNTDIWWHLASAREMIARKAFLRTDPFTFTPSLPWIDLHWGFQLAAYAIHRLGGPGLLVWVKVAMCAAACAVIVATGPGRRFPVSTGVLLAFCMFHVRFLVLARPVVVTMLLMAAFIGVLERYAQRRRLGVLALLLPLQVVWVNTQGLFALGLVIGAAYAIGATVEHLLPLPSWRDDERRRPALTHVGHLWGLFAALCAVSLLNPYGVRGLLFPFRLLGRIEPDLANVFSLNVSENLPLLELVGSEPLLVVLVVATALALIAVLMYDMRRIRPAHLVIFVGFLYLAFSAKRNILLYLFVAAPLLGGYAGPAVADVVRRARGRTRRGLVVGLAVLGIVVSGSNVYRHLRGLWTAPRTSMLSPFRYPVEASDYLRRHPVEGRLFNSVRYGGYILWEHYPPTQVFIDGRLIIRTPRFYADYLAVLDNPSRFHRVARAYDITHVLIPTAIFDRYLKLARELYDHPDWALAYTDGTSALFVERGRLETPPIDLSSPADIAAITGELRGRWHADRAILREALRYVEHTREALSGERTVTGVR